MTPIQQFRTWACDPSLSPPIRTQAERCLIWLRHFSFNPTSPFGELAVADFHRLEAMIGGGR